MGIVSNWIEEVIDSLSVLGINIDHISDGKYNLLQFADKGLVVNLLSLKKEYDPAALLTLQQQYAVNNIYLVHLWEDIWKSRSGQVLGRITSVLGLNKRLHARKAKIVTLTQKQADEFLRLNHLQASAKAKYRFALTINDEIVAVSCFSKLMLMKREAEGYRSAELIRFATLAGYTVTGGFSKLLKHFTDLMKPDDVMSYADRDWSLGAAYEKAGFKLVAVTPPAVIWLQSNTEIRYFTHRLPADFLEKKGGNSLILTAYLKIFNTGNLKYVLYL